MSESFLITKRKHNSSMVVCLDAEATEHLRRLLCTGTSDIPEKLFIYIAAKSAKNWDRWSLKTVRNETLEIRIIELPARFDGNFVGLNQWVVVY